MKGLNIAVGFLLCAGFLKTIEASPIVIRVAAAADLKFAMPELTKAYQLDHSNENVSASFGSSGNFATQIKQGAPYDIFFSADSSSLKILEGKIFPYSVGTVVLWVPNNSKLDLEKGIEVLNSSEIKQIAFANPTHAPYGVGAVEALRKSNLYDKVASKLVMGENIAQTAQFVESGAADIGLIAIALAMSPTLKKEGRYKPLDHKLYSAMIQSGIVLNRSQVQKQAKRFRDFVLSPKGQEILNRFGMGLHK
jgi:molybdate transport system substrate-binding protein